MFTYDRKHPGIIRSDTLKSGRSLTPSTFADMDKQDIIDERLINKEIRKADRYLNSLIDDITRYLRNKYSLPSMGVYNFYTNGNFPVDEQGNIMSVFKYYAPINLCVDLIPKDWPAGKIQAKKWMVERLGYRYGWLVEDEELTDEAEFLNRMEKLTTKPAYEIKPLIRRSY